MADIHVIKNVKIYKMFHAKSSSQFWTPSTLFLSSSQLTLVPSFVFTFEEFLCIYKYKAYLFKYLFLLLLQKW